MRRRIRRGPISSLARRVGMVRVRNPRGNRSHAVRCRPIPLPAPIHSTVRIAKNRSKAAGWSQRGVSTVRVICLVRAWSRGGNPPAS